MIVAHPHKNLKTGTFNGINLRVIGLECHQNCLVMNSLHGHRKKSID